MSRILLSILFAFSIYSGICQSNSVEFLLPSKFENIEVDQFGNIYLINRFSIEKRNAAFEKVAYYNNSSFGEIKVCDVSNPFRILIFSETFNQLMWLDKNLTPLSVAVSLDDLGFDEVSLVCAGIGNGFWLLDAFENCLVYIRDNLQTVHKSQRLDLDAVHKFVHLTEIDQRVVVSSSDSLLFYFDAYANLLNVFPEIVAPGFKAGEKAVVFINKNKVLVSFHFKDLVSKKLLSLSKYKVYDYDIQGDRLYLLGEEKLLITKISKNQLTESFE